MNDLTGDHPTTALVVARELNIAVDTDPAVTGHELDAMTDEATLRTRSAKSQCTRESRPSTNCASCELGSVAAKS